MTCRDRIRALLEDAHEKLQGVAHTNGARRSLADAIRELGGPCETVDSAAEYQAELRVRGERIRPEGS